MKRQRGIADGWLLVAAAVVLLGLLVGGIASLKSWTEGIERTGFQRGVKETEAKYAKRDNEQLRLTLTRVLDLESRARKAESRHAEELATIERKRNQEKTDAHKRHEADLAAVRAGNLRLRDPGRTACAPTGDRGQGPQAQGPAAERDGAAGSQLSDAASGVLLGIVNDADDLARQLAAAQAVILEQLRTCNGA